MRLSIGPRPCAVPRDFLRAFNVSIQSGPGGPDMFTCTQILQPLQYRGDECFFNARN